MATVYGIVKQNNGFIITSSEPYRGTTFSIYFPRVTDRKVEKRPKQPTEIVPGNNEILIVVDDDVFLLQKPFSRKELAHKVKKVLISPDCPPNFVK